MSNPLISSFNLQNNSTKPGYPESHYPYPNTFEIQRRKITKGVIPHHVSLLPTPETMNIFKKKHRKTKQIDYGLLRLRDTYPTNHGLRYLLQILTSTKILKRLNLHFKRCYASISDPSLQIISEGIGKLSSLEYLFINLTRCDYVSDIGVSALSKKISKLHSLKEITLKFDGCDNFTDSGLKSVSKAILKLPCLQKLTLTFDGWNKINYQKGLEFLGKSIGRIKSLQDISLTFHICSRITDESLRVLNKGIVEASNLQRIHIVVHECLQVTDQGVKNLSEGFLTLSSLKSLNLTFSL